MERTKRQILTSPKGVAKYITVITPDTKFKAEGEYRVTLLLPKDSDEAKSLIAKIEVGMQESMAAATKENKGKKVKSAVAPYKDDTDKEGNETGNVAFTFKAKASGKRQDGTEWDFKPTLYDAKGARLTTLKAVWGGSEVKVAFEIRPYFTQMVGAGVTLSLQAVQIIKLVTGTGGRDASAYGFGAEEGFDSSLNDSVDEGAVEEAASAQDF